VVECLPSNHKTLRSNLSTAERSKSANVCVFKEKQDSRYSKWDLAVKFHEVRFHMNLENKMKK
jgi:hypothetical protein